MTHPSGRFHRCTLLCPRVTLPGSASSVSVRCRFHTCRPVYRGFSRIVVTVPSVQLAPVRCVFRPGSAADGHGTPASFSARAIRATECPARRWAKIHRTTGAVAGSGSSRCARRPHAACALFGCGPASASRYPYGGRPPRYRPCSLVWAAIAVRTRMLVRVISRLDDKPSTSSSSHRARMRSRPGRRSRASTAGRRSARTSGAIAAYWLP